MFKLIQNIARDIEDKQMINTEIYSIYTQMNTLSKRLKIGVKRSAKSGQGAQVS